ncbi:hypothetical protein GCM10025868_10770 [Angustibacter aerolatus]|uniref:Uncharacterized protein n=1 Tax=Angustibacter aerolatus TaxID=1162965 RepID=A0ABQ6JCC9_9ACTN|nr:hypothetical protein GCM10025868_10770 [Angustibacter aerolatus]
MQAEAQYSDHDHRLVLVVEPGDEERTRAVVQAWGDGAAAADGSTP